MDVLKFKISRKTYAHYEEHLGFLSVMPTLIHGRRFLEGSTPNGVGKLPWPEGGEPAAKEGMAAC